MGNKSLSFSAACEWWLYGLVKRFLFLGHGNPLYLLFVFDCLEFRSFICCIFVYLLVLIECLFAYGRYFQGMLVPGRWSRIIWRLAPLPNTSAFSQLKTSAGRQWESKYMSIISRSWPWLLEVDSTSTRFCIPLLVCILWFSRMLNSPRFFCACRPRYNTNGRSSIHSRGCSFSLRELVLLLPTLPSPYVLFLGVE